MPVPDVPPPGGAILRVTANGICGADYDIYAGRTDPRYTPFPFIPGHEMVGELVRVDPGAAARWGVAEGDRVSVENNVACGACRECLRGDAVFCRSGFTYSLTSLDVAPGLWGGMAEYMVLQPGTDLTKVPDHLSDRDAALSNAFGNAFEWTSQAGQVGVGDRVLVLGSGQRGLACAAVAREAGAAQVIVTGLTRDAHKLALAGEFGASAVIDVGTRPTVERVEALTDGEGVDVAIDTVPGDTAPILDAIALLGRGAHSCSLV